MAPVADRLIVVPLQIFELDVIAVTDAEALGVYTRFMEVSGPTVLLAPAVAPYAVFEQPPLMMGPNPPGLRE